MIPPDPWVLDAACASSELPPEAWDVKHPLNAPAIATCASCPVRFQCQEQALADWNNRTPSVGVILAGRRWDSNNLCPECELPSYGIGSYCSPQCAHAALCGSMQGYRWHTQRGEKHCAACIQARRDGTNRPEVAPKPPKIEAGERICAARDCNFVYASTLSFKKFCSYQCKRREEKHGTRVRLPARRECAGVECDFSFVPVAKNHMFCSRPCQAKTNDRRGTRPRVDEVKVQQFIEDELPWKALDNDERREAIRVAKQRRVQLGSKFRKHRAESTQVRRVMS